MKKLLLISVLILSAVFSVFSQNANRSGLFIEAGVGQYLGTPPPPANKLEWSNNTLSIFKPGGPDINFGVGYRGATSSVFAWEIRAEVTTDVNAMSTLVLSAMPGFRLTSKEIFGNSSLYFGLNLGVALGNDCDYYSSSLQQLVNSYYELGHFGGKILLCGGLNITPSFYAGIYVNLNVMPGQAELYDNDNYNFIDNNNKCGDDIWGSVALRLGYRF